MAKVFRFSGYLLEVEEIEDMEVFRDRVFNSEYDSDVWQQLHIEESEEFELDGEDKPDCDLALLTRQLFLHQNLIDHYHR